MYTIIGLGNPGEEYAGTRHNAGREAEEFIGKNDIPGVKLAYIETFMNKSGGGVAKVIKSKKAAEKLVVIQDELDMPIGSLKMVYDRSSGGHRGVESIIKALGTQKFARIRIGISPVTPGGKMKKPLGEKNVEKHILGKFTPKEKEVLKKIHKKIELAVRTLGEEGLERAIAVANTK